MSAASGFATYEEAEAYARKLMKPASIMYGQTHARNHDSYHVILDFGVEHWKRRHLKEIAVCVPTLVVTRVAGAEVLP